MQYIGEYEFKRIGKKKWNKRMKRVIEILKVVFNYDRLVYKWRKCTGNKF